MFLCVCLCIPRGGTGGTMCKRCWEGMVHASAFGPGPCCSLSSLQVGISQLHGSSVSCSLGSGLERSSEAPGGLQASFAYGLITDFMPMKWISPVDCSASYLNGCFILLIYLFNPSVTLLPTESLKSLSCILQKSELCSFFDSSLKTVVKVNDNQLSIEKYFKFPFSWIHLGLRNMQHFITTHDLQNAVKEWKSFVCGIEVREEYSAWGWYINTETIVPLNQELLNSLNGQAKAALRTCYRSTSSWCSQVLCAPVSRPTREFPVWELDFPQSWRF